MKCIEYSATRKTVNQTDNHLGDAMGNHKTNVIT